LGWFVSIHTFQVSTRTSFTPVVLGSGRQARQARPSYPYDEQSAPA
jgi:hypothetical protein